MKTFFIGTFNTANNITGFILNCKPDFRGLLSSFLLNLIPIDLLHKPAEQVGFAYRALRYVGAGGRRNDIWGAGIRVVAAEQGMGHDTGEP